jgi:transposase
LGEEGPLGADLQGAPIEKRYRVECFFHSLKRFRAIATRFEKTARNFLALTHVVCAWLWLAPN